MLKIWLVVVIIDDMVDSFRIFGNWVFGINIVRIKIICMVRYYFLE